MSAEAFCGHPLPPQSAAWHARRKLGIGGSDARKIMLGDWLDLWLEKTGRAAPEDLSNVLPVQLGTFTEPFNREWFERVSGKPVTTEDCDGLQHPEFPFMLGNLDGRLVFESAFLECKHVNAFSKEEELLTRYYPQIQHYLSVSGLDKCYLSVIIGTMKYEYFEVSRDDEYIERLIIREAEFWGHVENDIEPPHTTQPEAVAISFDDMREVDHTGSNEWANHAGIWLRDRAAAKTFKAAETGIKELVEADVKKAMGHGITVSRSKSGSLTIRESK